MFMKACNLLINGGAIILIIY